MTIRQNLHADHSIENQHLFDFSNTKILGKRNFFNKMFISWYYQVETGSEILYIKTHLQDDFLPSNLLKNKNGIDPLTEKISIPIQFHFIC